MPFCTRADLEEAVGGAATLLQLADFAHTGNALDAGVAARINGWLEDGAGEVRSRAEVRHDPETLAALDVTSLRRCIDANACLSGRVAFEKGTSGLAMPDKLAARCERIDAWLVELGAGRVRLGRASGQTAAAINQDVGVYDHDPRGMAVSDTGFRRGFR